jgi:CRISPR/Cas system CSM-associated protein Csm3 (group 7 of RAMP superfamily)
MRFRYYIGYTLEALSAHALATGQGDGIQDTQVLRDAHGLPCLPATSIAGVLRHLYEAQHGPVASQELFGFIDNTDGRASHLKLTWAFTHDSTNRVAEGLALPDSEDPLIQLLHQAKPIIRQRVRLNSLGAAADTALYDLTLVPRGTRYSGFFEIVGTDQEHVTRQWQQLSACLTDVRFRLGTGSRSGLGAFKLVALTGRCYDLETELTAYGARPRRRNDLHTLPLLSPAVQPSQPIKLALRATDSWAIGGGQTSLTANSLNNIALIPQTEPVIVWTANRANINPQIVAPGSALKGALRHRVAFHHRRICQEWAEKGLAEHNTATDLLFGYERSGTGDDVDGQAGLLWFHDLYLQKNVTLHEQMHNRLDRFTGGVMAGGLYSTQSLWQSHFELEIGCSALESIDANVLHALRLALEDLCCSRLPLGANGSRGLGAMTGTIVSQPTYMTNEDVA